MTRRRRSKGKHRRRNPGALLVNPSRRRRGRIRRHRGRRRNPGLMSAAKEGVMLVLKSAIPAVVGGALLGFADAKFLGTRGMVIRLVGKGVLATVAGVAGRRFLGREAAAVAVGAVLGSIGSEIGIKLAGGIVAGTKKEGLKELISDPGDDEEVRDAMAALTEGTNLGQSYERAAQTNLGESYIDAAAQNYTLGDEMGDEMG